VPDTSTTAAPTAQAAPATAAPSRVTKATKTTNTSGASALPPTAGSSVASGTVGAASPVTATLGARQLTGPGTTVADPQASTGSAVMIKSGTLKGVTSLAAGAYVLSARVRSEGERMALSADGRQVGTAAVAGGAWQVVSVPVRVAGPTSWGVTPIGGIGSHPSQALYVDSVSIQPTTPGYTTNGNQILDPTGQPVTPRGVNRNGLEFQSQGYGMSDGDFGAMYYWGSTIVRLQLSEAFWLPSSCKYDPAYAERVDQAVLSITRRGMIALLDLHSTQLGLSCGQLVNGKAADDYSPQFWSDVATRYMSNPMVAFDLFNEPGYPSDVMWQQGGNVTYQGRTWHVPGMQQLYDAVRATGAGNLVFIEGQQFAYDVGVGLRQPIDGYGIVYQPHIYYKDDSGPLPPDIDSVILPVAAQYPVWVGEFGTQKDSGTYNSNVIAYAESHNLNGWAAFAWNAAGPPAWSLLASWATYQPSAAGQPVLDALWKARGWTGPGH
jgi:endoglucanase